MTTQFQDLALNTIQRQYGYTNIAKLIIEKAKVFDKYIGDITTRFGKEVLDYNICSSNALDYFWGLIFKITRIFKDDDENIITLTDTQFRTVIKILAFKTTWQGDLYSLNYFFNNVIFKDRGIVRIFDDQLYFLITYAFTFDLEEWEKVVFNKDYILPRNAGVGFNLINIIPEVKYFGYKLYEEINPNPQAVGYRVYGSGNPTGDGVYYKYGDPI